MMSLFAEHFRILGILNRQGSEGREMRLKDWITAHVFFIFLLECWPLQSLQLNVYFKNTICTVF